MTDQTLTHQVIYSVFVRCHTPEGTFPPWSVTWTASALLARTSCGSCPSTPSG